MGKSLDGAREQTEHHGWPKLFTPILWRHQLLQRAQGNGKLGKLMHKEKLGSFTVMIMSDLTRQVTLTARKPKRPHKSWKNDWAALLLLRIIFLSSVSLIPAPEALLGGTTSTQHRSPQSSASPPAAPKCAELVRFLGIPPPPT